MKYYLTLSLTFTASLFLTNCATSTSYERLEAYEANKIKDASSTSSGRQIAGDAPRLSARDLPRGECGLFVWTADQSRRFILFAQSQKRQAVWAGPTGEVPLLIADQSGQVYQEQFAKQSFATTSSDKNAPIVPNLKLDLRNSEELLDSTRFKAGTLIQIIEDGLERVAPIVALSTCRA